MKPLKGLLQTIAQPWPAASKAHGPVDELLDEYLIILVVIKDSENYGGLAFASEDDVYAAAEVSAEG